MRDTGLRVEFVAKHKVRLYDEFGARLDSCLLHELGDMLREFAGPHAVLADGPSVSRAVLVPYGKTTPV